MMTVEALKREAMKVMASMKAQIETLNEADPICMLHWPLDLAASGKKLFHPAMTPGEWSRFPILGSIMNSGDAKREYFGAVRELVRYTGADGVIFATDVWGAQLTDEGRKHGQQEWNSHVDTGFAKLVRMGWATRVQAIHITAQSKTDVVFVDQEYHREGRGRAQFLHEVRTRVGPQSEFGGRQKMFGDLREENLGEPPGGSPAERHQKGGGQQ